MKTIKYKIVLVILLMILSQQGISQDLIRTNPADITDPQALFINPALLPYQNLSFNVGMKIYHLGFIGDNSVGLRHGYSSTSVPNVLLNGVGIGLTFQNFNSPYHSDNGIGISLGYCIRPSFSLGFSVQGSNFHLDKDKLGPVELADPLLSRMGKWYFSYGAGMLIRPGDKFSAGLSLNNINRPSKSFESGNNEERNRVPLEMDLGAKYYFNNVFGISAFSHMQKYEFTPGIAGEVNIDNEGLIRAGYVDHGIMFEGQIKVRGGFGIVYRLDYPFSELTKVSYGSHQLGLTWNMKFNLDYTFNIQVSVDTIRVIKECTKIRIKKNEDREKLFTKLDYIDLQFPENKKTTEQIPVEEPSQGGMALDDIGRYLPYNDHLEAYKDNFLEIRDYMKSTDKDFTIDIYYADATTAERAMVIKNYLIDSLSFKDKNIKLHQESNGKSADHDQQQAKKDSIKLAFDISNDRFSNSEYIEISTPSIEQLIPEKVIFQLTNKKLTRVSHWRILITNSLGDPVHEIVGINNIESLVEWDGFQDDGTLLEVGNYYYQFQYSAGGSSNWIPKDPKRYPLAFIRVDRAKTIEITTDAINNLTMLKEVVIRLKEPY